jgi:hypothetical protein
MTQSQYKKHFTTSNVVNQYSMVNFKKVVPFQKKKDTSFHALNFSKYEILLVVRLRKI